MKNMYKLIIILFALLTSGCIENNYLIKGKYRYSSIFLTETYIFYDSTRFCYRYSPDDDGAGFKLNGTYSILANKLILNFDVFQSDKPFVYNKIDSISRNSDSLNLDIYLIDSYTEKPISLAIIIIKDMTGRIVSKDTSDNTGHINKKIPKNNNGYILETSFVETNWNNNYYRTALNLFVNYDYSIYVHTVKRDNYLLGETIEYNLLDINANGFELEYKSKPYKKKKFLIQNEKFGN